MSEKTKYQIILEEFLENKSWKDELEIDSEAATVTLNTRVNLGDQGGRLIIQASDQSDLIDFIIYYDLKCKESKLEQMALLMNAINLRWVFGRFQAFPDGYVRWWHRVDFEGSQPSGLSLQRNIQPGWDAASQFAEVIAAVALTKQTAEEAITDYDDSNKSTESDETDGDVPTEL